MLTYVTAIFHCIVLCRIALCGYTELLGLSLWAFIICFQSSNELKTVLSYWIVYLLYYNIDMMALRDHEPLYIVVWNKILL